MGAQPTQESKEDIESDIWSGLTARVESRIALLEVLARGRSLLVVTHSFYKPLWPLLTSLAAILVVDRFWLDKSEPRNDPGYVGEAFQRLILQFILDNLGKEFMQRQVENHPREVKVITLNRSLSETTSQKMDAENSRKLSSTLPSFQQVDEVAEDASYGDKEGKKEEEGGVPDEKDTAGEDSKENEVEMKMEVPASRT